MELSAITANPVSGEPPGMDTLRTSPCSKYQSLRWNANELPTMAISGLEQFEVSVENFFLNLAGRHRSEIAESPQTGAVRPSSKSTAARRSLRT